jgi:hypothetical protein
MMTDKKEREISAVAENVLRDLSIWRLPIDPLEIARQEEIAVTPGYFQGGFEGRIRYLLPERVFSLIYQVAGAGRPLGKVNFTLCHELGHFYLHRDYLTDGKSHSSVTDFRSHEAMEIEADCFAASLLMPAELFAAEVKSFRHGYCDLENLCRLSEKLGASVTSTVRRYCQIGLEPVLAVFSSDGIVNWSCCSDDMRRLGMGFVRAGTSLPSESLSARMKSEEQVRGDVDAYAWFDSPRYSGKLWEESITLGSTGIRLTYLAPSENPWSN